MATDLKQVAKRLWGLPRAFRIIAAVALVDAAVLIFTAFWLEVDVDAQTEKIGQLKSQLATQQQKVGMTRTEIGRLPELRRLYDKAVASGLLAEPDRIKLVERIQAMIDGFRLSDLHYKLAGEQSPAGVKTKYILVGTPVTLDNTALLDLDVFTFWHQVLSGFSTHYQIESATLERTNTDPLSAAKAIEIGRTTPLVKAEIVFHWMVLRRNPDAPKTPQPGSGAQTAQAGDTDQ
jgi:cell division protein FtsL